MLIADAMKSSGSSSFVQVVTSRDNNVFLVRGKDKDRAAWHYLKVDKKKLPFFQKKIKSGNIKVTDYGIILYSGWGIEPPEDIKQKIKEQFGS